MSAKSYCKHTNANNPKSSYRVNNWPTFIDESRDRQPTPFIANCNQIGKLVLPLVLTAIKVAKFSFTVNQFS
ncbi:hypothetical protein DXX93_16775 [Thalassotalea euphylliae]|uniref:Uncharacterized protein n=1 Tax=Thalassotalea euphylliae TaxID=1655234 RepID=A0A3E0TVV8_9GAMM|nr:hypothetical protein DXX93_16775 [Thalassotalea euphylliae]